MGYYIDPPDMSKEEFLRKHGTLMKEVPSEYDFSGDSLPICLVDNGLFTAAGIMYSQRELDAFKHPDGRPKFWFEVSREDLKPYYNK